MNNKDFSSIGEQIRASVQEAVDSINFGQLSRDINKSVNSAIDEVRNSIRTGYTGTQNNQRMRDKGGPQGPSPSQWERERQRQRESQNQRQGQTDGYRRASGVKVYQNKYTPVYISKNPPGKYSGTVLKVLGYTGVGIFGISTIVMMVLSEILTGSIINVLENIGAGLMLLTIISWLVSWRGKKIKDRYHRFCQYANYLQGRTFCTISEIAAQIGKSERYVVKDLRKMIHLRMFPEGHIDKKNVYFILNHETYKQYLTTQEAFEKKQQQIASQEKKEEQREEKKTKDNADNMLSEELREAITQGNAYIEQIKAANDAIPGEEISRKLDRLEEISTKIFLCVKKYPEKLPEIRKFMEYYLPTTLKLVYAYKEFDAQPIQGENITNSKKEIQKTLDTINYAFENLLDSLYEDVAMEVSTDITVLQTLLAQEGLTEKDFNLSQKEE